MNLDEIVSTLRFSSWLSYFSERSERKWQNWLAVALTGRDAKTHSLTLTREEPEEKESVLQIFLNPENGKKRVTPAHLQYWRIILGGRNRLCLRPTVASHILDGRRARTPKGKQRGKKTQRKEGEHWIASISQKTKKRHKILTGLTAGAFSLKTQKILLPLGGIGNMKNCWSRRNRAVPFSGVARENNHHEGSDSYWGEVGIGELIKPSGVQKRKDKKKEGGKR